MTVPLPLSNTTGSRHPNSVRNTHAMGHRVPHDDSKYTLADDSIFVEQETFVNELGRLECRITAVNTKNNFHLKTDNRHPKQVL
jgi:hypothetical protein